MNKALLSFVILAVVVAFAACKKPTSRDQFAYVTFVNGCAADSPAYYLDARASTVTVAGGSYMGPLQSTGYKGILSGGSIHFAYFLSGGYKVAELTRDILPTTNYSFFIGGSVGNPKLAFTQDDMTIPTPGNIKIRFANMSNDTFHVTAFARPGAGSPKINYATDVTAIQVTPFIEIAAGTYDLTAFDPYSLSDIAMLGAITPIGQQLEEGKIYTVMMAGTLKGTGTAGLTLTLIQNN